MSNSALVIPNNFTNFIEALVLKFKNKKNNIKCSIK